MKTGELVLVQDTPAVFCGGEGRNAVAYVLGKGRGYYEASAFKEVEITPELAARFVPLLPDAIFAPAHYTVGKTGSDPEIFAFDKSGKVLPAWDWLPKNDGKQSMYWDGVQAEFNIDPSHCHSYVVDNVQARLKAMYTKLQAYKPGAELIAQDVVNLDTSILELADEEYVNLGCSPSTNAYPQITPISIPDPRKHSPRYSGCHLHYSVAGLPTPDWFPHGTVVMMDKILGVCLTALGRHMENPVRRIAYGRPGEYRIPGNKDNRLEYRTPGAFLLHHPAIFSFACDIGRAAYRMGLQLDGRYHPLPDVTDVITRCDADGAMEIINSNRTIFEHIFQRSGYNSKGTLSILAQGARNVFTGKLSSNWRFDRQWLLHNATTECMFAPWSEQYANNK